eukprot:scaffold647699_cov51-Prasinocladus_malaysianus.AAC.1
MLGDWRGQQQLIKFCFRGGVRLQPVCGGGFVQRGAVCGALGSHSGSCGGAILPLVLELPGFLALSPASQFGRLRCRPCTLRCVGL